MDDFVAVRKVYIRKHPQVVKMEAAHRKLHDAMQVFADIQNGPNPLTREEIARIKALRPGKYEWIP